MGAGEYISTQIKAKQKMNWRNKTKAKIKTTKYYGKFIFLPIRLRNQYIRLIELCKDSNKK